MPANPYLITGPALISFSGGETSGRMLKGIIDAHGGTLPDDIFVGFANTGQEDPKTLRFVHECATRWGVRVRWLEFVTDLKSAGAAGRFEEVGFNSASRNGEPLDRLIARKQALFSTITGRWCTERCKVGVLHDFMEANGYPRGRYTEVICFRADEYDRVYELPRKPRNEDRHLAFPLAEAGVRKADVIAWWEPQPFRLGLRKGTGNCNQCPFVSEKARIARARLSPETIPWWKAHEKARGFAFGFMSFEDIERHIAANPLLPGMDDVEADAADSECGGWCSGEDERVRTIDPNPLILHERNGERKARTEAENCDGERICSPLRNHSAIGPRGVRRACGLSRPESIRRAPAGQYGMWHLHHLSKNMNCH